ncbi:MAG: response regulator [Chloroflexota bacterium]
MDDDRDIREVVTLALSDEGYDVLAAPNGAVGLDFAREHSPDLILLDMRMPIMDGWEFAQAYRQLPSARAPIVVLTAATDAGQRAAEVQASGYLGKPFDLDDLLDTVEHFTHPDAA